MTVSRVRRSWWTDDSGAVTLYDLATGDAVGTYVPDADDCAESLAMSPDGGRLALLMESGRLIVLDVERIVEGDDQAGRDRRRHRRPRRGQQGRSTSRTAD